MVGRVRATRYGSGGASSFYISCSWGANVSTSPKPCLASPQKLARGRRHMQSNLNATGTARFIEQIRRPPRLIQGHHCTGREFHRRPGVMTGAGYRRTQPIDEKSILNSYLFIFLCSNCARRFAKMCTRRLMTIRLRLSWPRAEMAGWIAQVYLQPVNQSGCLDVAQ